MKIYQGSLLLEVVVACMRGASYTSPCSSVAKPSEIPVELHFEVSGSRLCYMLPFPLQDLEEQTKLALFWPSCSL